MSRVSNGRVIVLDHGSTSIKAGFAGEDCPVCVVPALTGVVDSTLERHEIMMSAKGRSNFAVSSKKDAHAQPPPGHALVGKEASRLQSEEGVSVTRALERGQVKDWDALQALWSHIFETELQVDVESQSVLLSDWPLGVPGDREKLTELLFDKYHVAGVSVCSKAVLSLFSTGRTRGIVAGMGGGVCSVVPVFEGFALPHASRLMRFAGEDLTDVLQRKLSASSQRTLSRGTLESIKAAVCTLAPSPLALAGFTGVGATATAAATAAAAAAAAAASTVGSGAGTAEAGAAAYELPDGTILEVSPDCRCSVPEALFDRSVLEDAGMPPPASGVGVGAGDAQGISELVFQCIESCDKTLQKDLLSQVVVAGGSSMFPGLKRRMEADLVEFSGATPAEVHVVADSQRKQAAWMGGSMLASLDTYAQIEMTRAEWEEHGPRLVREKTL